MAQVDESEVRRLVREAVERALARPSAVPGPAAGGRKRVAIGADHGGYALKEVLKRFIAEELDWEVHDCGTHSGEAVDYPDYAAAVGRAVASSECGRGIVVDAAGIGSTMAANKIPGVRCALCHDDATVRNAREHNDANVLTLGAKFVDASGMREIVETFLASACTEERHARRVKKIKAIEETYSR